MVKINCFVLLILAVFSVAGCKPSSFQEIPGIAKDHPANKFYAQASYSVLTDKTCKENQGNPNIPMGEVAKGEKYGKNADLAPGVFRFREKATGKTFLGVSYLQWEMFLQFPKLCSWEEEK